MTENQTKEIFNLLTKCVNGIQDLKEDVSVLKGDVSVLKEDVSEMKQDINELKEGQKRIEKEVRLNTAGINELASQQFNLNVRVSELERASA